MNSASLGEGCCYARRVHNQGSFLDKIGKRKIYKFASISKIFKVYSWRAFLSFCLEYEHNSFYPPWCLVCGKTICKKGIVFPQWTCERYIQVASGYITQMHKNYKK